MSALKIGKSTSTKAKHSGCSYPDSFRFKSFVQPRSSETVPLNFRLWTEVIPCIRLSLAVRQPDFLIDARLPEIIASDITYTIHPKLQYNFTKDDGRRPFNSLGKLEVLRNSKLEIYLRHWTWGIDDLLVPCIQRAAKFKHRGDICSERIGS